VLGVQHVANGGQWDDSIELREGLLRAAHVDVNLREFESVENMGRVEVYRPLEVYDG
jgi:hypothetical protein